MTFRVLPKEASIHPLVPAAPQAPSLHASVTVPREVGRTLKTRHWRERAERHRDTLRERAPLSVPLLGLLVALGLWVLSLRHVNPRAMTNFGLLSVLPPTFEAALVVLTGSFLVALYHPPRRSWLIIAHLLALVLILRGTPEIVYGTLRYTWAYKHVGIVDYILRHDAVNPTIPSLRVYQDWPGFFAVVAMLAKLAGLRTVLDIAGWAPVFNNVLYLAALIFLYSALTDKRSVIWMSCWLFVIADWVGQDYFSPQGFAYLMYLLMVGVVLRWLRPGARSRAPGKAAVICLVLLLVGAMTITHALTAVMACIALAVLVLARACSARWLAPIALAMTIAWDVTFASHYAGTQLSKSLASIRLPWETTSSNLVNFSTLNPDTALVAQVSRAFTLLVMLLALFGAVRLLRNHSLDRGVTLLAASPVLLFATGNYDGELLFRIFLFSVPFLSFLGVHTFAASRPLIRIPAATIILLAVLALFLVSNYGDERASYVTPQETTAARWVDAHSPPGSLVIAATDCDVLWTEYYEHFTCIPFSLQPSKGLAHILDDPATVLHKWATNRRYPGAAYVFLSTNQQVSVEEYGTLPQDTIATVRRALIASPKFRVAYRNSNAIVFAPAGAHISVVGSGARAAVRGPGAKTR